MLGLALLSWAAIPPVRRGFVRGIPDPTAARDRVVHAGQGRIDPGRTGETEPDQTIIWGDETLPMDATHSQRDSPGDQIKRFAAACQGPPLETTARDGEP